MPNEQKLGRGNYSKIARRAHLHPAHVGRILKGYRGTSLFVAARIAQAASVTLDELYEYICLNADELRLTAKDYNQLRKHNPKGLNRVEVSGL